MEGHEKYHPEDGKKDEYTLDCWTLTSKYAPQEIENKKRTESHNSGQQLRTSDSTKLIVNQMIPNLTTSL